MHYSLFIILNKVLKTIIIQKKIGQIQMYL